MSRGGVVVSTEVGSAGRSPSSLPRKASTSGPVDLPTCPELRLGLGDGRELAGVEQRCEGAEADVEHRERLIPVVRVADDDLTDGAREN